MGNDKLFSTSLQKTGRTRGQESGYLRAYTNQAFSKKDEARSQLMFDLNERDEGNSRICTKMKWSRRKQRPSLSSRYGFLDNKSELIDLLNNHLRVLFNRENEHW